MPTKKMQKSDNELHAIMDKDWKKAREKLVSKMLTKDEHGNTVNKQYSELSSKEIGLIA